MKLTNIVLPSPFTNSHAPTHDIEISNHIIKSITPHTHSADLLSASSTPCSPPSLLLPTLCHPHIHLDKPYLLTSNYNHPAAYPPCCPQPSVATPSPSSQATNNTQPSIQSKETSRDILPDYSALAPKSGSFPEALQLTSEAKRLYTPDDLYWRGKQLLATSYTQGVTSARCFVEVDHAVGGMCVDVGLQLKRDFEGKDVMRVQLCAFAQDPIFSSEHGEENRRILEEVLEKYAGESRNGRAGEDGGGRVEVLGTTPYVEQTREAALRNIEWAIRTALKYDLHLDFHLDYDLDESKRPEELMVWQVLRLLMEDRWPTSRDDRKEASGAGSGLGGESSDTSEGKSTSATMKKRVKTVVLGHCSALTLLPHEGPYSLTSLASKIRESTLPVYFVGLPTSDLYMMGRPSEHQDIPLHRPRGTLNILALTQTYGLKGCIAINNVGNAFTPFGSGDPLELAAWCVGIYQGGGEGDAEVLYCCVSTRAREAIRLEIARKDGGERDEGSAGKKEMEGAVMENVENGGKEIGSGRGLGIQEGMDIGDFGLMVVRNEEYIGGNKLQEVGMEVPARRRVCVRDVVWDVPEVRLRSAIR